MELGLPLARSENTGGSLFYDAKGRLLDSTPIFEEAAIRAELEIPASPAPFAAVGGPLEAILLALLLAVFAWALFTRDPEFP